MKMPEKLAKRIQPLALGPAQKVRCLRSSRWNLVLKEKNKTKIKMSKIILTARTYWKRYRVADVVFSFDCYAPILTTVEMRLLL